MSAIDSQFSLKWGPLPVDFRHLGGKSLFVNALCIEVLSPVSYQDWKNTENAKSFLAKLPKALIQDGGYYPKFWLNYRVAIEYAKTCKQPLSDFIAEQSKIIFGIGKFSK